MNLICNEGRPVLDCCVVKADDLPQFLLICFMILHYKRKNNEEESTLKPSLGSSLKVVRQCVYTVKLQNNSNLKGIFGNCIKIRE